MKQLLALATVGLLSNSSTNAADLASEIDRLAQPYVNSETVVGMSIGVIKGNRSAVRGYGRLSTGDATVPDERTVYEIGSISKVFTGLLLADAVANERVSLDTPVEELLPSSIKMQQRDEAIPIRLRHLSTHTSGLPRLPDNLEPADPNNPYADYDGKRLANFLRTYRPRKRPGERSEYSNLAAGLLGAVLSFDQEVEYGTLLGQRIAQPLGLTDTTIELDDDQKARLAPPHTEGGIPDHCWTFDQLAGAGAIRSTVDDMLQFAQSNLYPPDGKLGEAIDLAWQVHQQPIDDANFAMGLGWHVARDGTTRWHNGQTGGYHASLFANRELDVAVVVLTNTATDEVDQLAEQLVRMLAGSAEKPREFETVLKVEPEKLQPYVGKYQVAPGAVFTVTTKGDQLLVGLTGQPTFRVYPRSNTEWYYKVVEATLTFHVDESGQCNSVELFQNGVRQTAKRIE